MNPLSRCKFIAYVSTMSVNTNSKMDNEDICALCKISATKKCTGCNIVYYCSREHQKSDWKLHSKICRPYELVDDSIVGRRYIAKRRIEIDEILLREDKHLLSVPPFDDLTCLSCYCLLTINTVKQCDKCGWHLCSNCTKHGPECELTMKYRKKKVRLLEYILMGTTYVYAIAIMRAMYLRDNDPDAYQRLMRHESHCIEEARRSMRSLQPNRSRRDIANAVKEYMKIKDMDVLEISKIIGIMLINTDVGNFPPFLFAGVHEKAAYFEHNCHANCITTCTQDGRILFRAIETIEKGQPLTRSYHNTFLGSAERGRYLKKEKYFTCNCERCKDPTEFGTMFNSVKCIDKKCSGYMLPPTFVVSYDEKIPDYVCDLCNATITSDSVDKMTEEIAKEYSRVDKMSLNELKKFIDKQESIVHENHFSIIEAKLRFTCVISFDQNTLSSELLNENITLCKKLTHLLKTIMPEHYNARGETLYSMYSSIHTLVFVRGQQMPQVFEHFVNEHRNVLTEASRFLRYAPLVKKNLIDRVHERLNLLNRFALALGD